MSGVTMIDRVVAILEAFKNADGPLTASDLARCTGIPVPSTHRIVADLVRTQLLERDSDFKLRIGMRLWEIAARSTRILSLREIALPFMEDLLAVVKAPTLLSILDGNDVVNLETLSPRNPSATNVTHPGVRLPALVSSPGIVLIAFAPNAIRTKIFDTGQPIRFTPYTVVDTQMLRRHVDETRRAGHAAIKRWMYPDSTGIAVPVLRDDGTAIAALSVTTPFDAGVQSDLLPALFTTARGIARAVKAEDVPHEPDVALLKQQLRRATGIR
jgi:DNA-binding IclR family transcriptional regulator